MKQMEISEVKVGMQIEATTFTHSQKWFLEYPDQIGVARRGEVVETDGTVSGLKIRDEQGEYHYPLFDVGSSGWHVITLLK